MSVGTRGPDCGTKDILAGPRPKVAVGTTLTKLLRRWRDDQLAWPDRLHRLCGTRGIRPRSRPLGKTRDVDGFAANDVADAAGGLISLNS